MDFGQIDISGATCSKAACGTGLGGVLVNLCADRAARTRWIGLQTLIFRECGVIVRFWSHTLAPPVIATVLYCTIFGEALGERIGSLDGFEYLQYMAPGLAMMWVVIYAYGHTAGGLLGARF